MSCTSGVLIWLMLAIWLPVISVNLAWIAQSLDRIASEMKKGTKP